MDRRTEIAAELAPVFAALEETQSEAERSVREAEQEAEAALLRYVADQADEAGVAVDVVQMAGEPFRHILEQARSWDAELIVMGRSDRRGPSSPYLGSVTEHVLEFAECPVLVVPQARAGGGGEPDEE